MFMFFRCMTDVNLPAIGPYKLSKAPAVVAMVPKVVVGRGRSTVRVAVSVAIVVCEVGRRDLVNWGDGFSFLEVSFIVPWLPVGSWATKKDLPGHLVPRKIGVRPQAARAASEAYVLYCGSCRGGGQVQPSQFQGAESALYRSG
jgi:hypothetical protein